MENNQELNRARAVYYGVFSRFFIYGTDVNEYFFLRDTLKTLSDNPIDATSKKALDEILNSLDSTSNVALLAEFDDIFHNPTTSTIRTSASFYDEGVESGKKRVEMQQFLGKTKIRRNEESFSEYEDHFGFVFTVMSELSNLIADKEESYTTLSHCIFTEILNPYIDEFIGELYNHESGNIFKNVAILLNSFITFERAFLEVNAPVQEEKIAAPAPMEEEISQEERERRARNKAAKMKDQVNQACALESDYDVEQDI